MGDKGSGGFFAVDYRTFDEACKAGLYSGLALLVLARFSDRQNTRTRASVQALVNNAGIGRRRAEAAIDRLRACGMIVNENQDPRPRVPPRWTITISDPPELIWLPNEIVDGAAGETAPIRLMRESQDVGLLRFFLRLYQSHDLVGDGGIPKDHLRLQWTKKRIASHGEWEIFGFSWPGEWSCDPRSDLWKDAGSDWPRHVQHFLSLGLLYPVPYVFESGEVDAEPIYACDSEAGESPERETAALVRAFAEERIPTASGSGFRLLAIVPRHMREAEVFNVYRLRYRPKTSATALWWATISRVRDEWRNRVVNDKPAGLVAAG